MMKLYRLVHLVETRSEALAAELLERVKISQAATAYKQVPDDELRDRVYEIYSHLADWLLVSDEAQLQRRYQRIGAQRAAQGVPFSQVAWVIVLTKQNLWEFLKTQLTNERPVEAYGGLELLELLDLFFDRAIYHAAEGYELRTSQSIQNPAAIQQS